MSHESRRPRRHCRGGGDRARAGRVSRRRSDPLPNVLPHPE
jgi:hypothetical protein